MRSRVVLLKKSNLLVLTVYVKLIVQLLNCIVKQIPEETIMISILKLLFLWANPHPAPLVEIAKSRWCCTTQVESMTGPP